MSIKSSKMKLFGMLGVVFLGFSFGYLMNKNHNRTPASTSLKTPVLPKPWAHSVVGKSNRLVQMTIAPVDGIPNNDNQEIRLRALVTLLAPIDGDLEFTWILPAGVSLVSGELEDSWPNILVGQTASTEISVVGFSKESSAKTIVLRVGGNSGDLHLGGSVTFATEDFKRIENQAASLSAQLAKGMAEKALNEQDEGLIRKRPRSAFDRIQQ